MENKTTLFKICKDLDNSMNSQSWIKVLNTLSNKNAVQQMILCLQNYNYKYDYPTLFYFLNTSLKINPVGAKGFIFSELCKEILHNTNILKMFLAEKFFYDELFLIPNNLGQTVLWDIIKKENAVDIFYLLLEQRLIDQKTFNIRNICGETILWEIIDYKKTPILNLLMQQGFINKDLLKIQNNCGETVLWTIFRKENALEILDLLLAQKLIDNKSLKIQKSYGNTVLEQIILHTDRDMIIYQLIDKKVINIKTALIENEQLFNIILQSHDIENLCNQFLKPNNIIKESFIKIWGQKFPSLGDVITKYQNTEEKDNDKYLYQMFLIIAQCIDYESMFLLTQQGFTTDYTAKSSSTKLNKPISPLVKQNNLEKQEIFEHVQIVIKWLSYKILTENNHNLFKKFGEDIINHLVLPMFPTEIPKIAEILENNILEQEEIPDLSTDISQDITYA